MSFSHIDWQAGDGLPARDDSARTYLERKIRRQSVLFGPRAAKRYMARLVEMDECAIDGEDFYDRAGAILGLDPVRAFSLVEDPEHRVS